MSILIVIVVVTLVAAGIGAGVYVLIFRAKHKKEMMANSQMGDNVPVYGPTSEQQAQGQPTYGGMAGMSQPSSSPTPGPMMNDITGSGPSNDTLAGGMSQNTQPQAQEPSFEVPQEPSVSHSFAPEAASQETQTDSVPPAPVGQAPALDNALDLNQLGAQNESGGSLLDNTETSGSVSGMAEDSVDTSLDSGISDSTVPVTEEDSVTPPAPEISAEPVQSAPEQVIQPEPIVEQSTPADIPTPTVEPQPESVNPVPEPPVAPGVSVPTNTQVPQPPTPIENAVPTPDNAGSEQETDTKEMHI